MKPTAFVINIGRAAIIDEEALYRRLKDNRIGGAAIDVWWQHPRRSTPTAAGSRLPFHELPNVMMTPHCSRSPTAPRDRRCSDLAANLDRYVRGEPLHNVVMTT